jgi:aryl-alcohol dehydrogenase-like predicted oxidoreductase
MMETRRLGKTALEITEVGFGAWAIGGGGWKFGWGSQEDEESIAAIGAALDLGVNWIDTARIYGLGHSEEVVAEALRGRDDAPLVFTKCSRVWDDAGEIEGSLKRDSIRAELEESLRRLERDTIDLYFIHQPKPDNEIEEGWETLAELREEGLIRFAGVSNFNLDQLQRAQRIAPIDVLQPRYSLIARDIESSILPFCARHGIGVIGYSPMGSGLLTGGMSAARVAAMDEDDWRRTHPDFTEPLLARHLELAERLAEIGARHGVTAGNVAIAWSVRNPDVHGAIVGFRSAAQVRDVIGDGIARLSDEDYEDLARFTSSEGVA